MNQRISVESLAMEASEESRTTTLYDLFDDTTKPDDKILESMHDIDLCTQITSEFEEPVSTLSTSTATIGEHGLFRRLHSRRSQYTEAEWDVVKETVERLYLKNGYTLPTVQGIMSKPPYDFHATTNMYKKQFKKWGFEKNMTQKRAYKLMNDDSNIAGSVRTFIGMDRIGQYFKRKKAVHDVTSTILGLPELPDTTWSPLVELDSTPVELDSTPVELDSTEAVFDERFDGRFCKYVREGSCKFRVEITDQTDGLLTTYHADSWGSRNYHPLNERYCPEGCPCRFFCDRRCFPTVYHSHSFGEYEMKHRRSHVFRVRCYQDSIVVDIQEPRLISNLKRIIGEANPFLIMELESLFSSTQVDGKALLKYYWELRNFVDHPGPSALLSKDAKSELLLFIEFLEDVDIWERIGLEKLARAGFLDPVLYEKLLNERLNERLRLGIKSLNSVFKEADAFSTCHTMSPEAIEEHFIDDFNSTQVYELDGTPKCDTPSADVTSEGFEPLPERDHTSVDTLLNQLPGHYMTDIFYDKLPKEWPQLLDVTSRPPDLQPVFGEELEGILMTESFRQPQIPPEKQDNNELNSRLLSACISGALGVVTSLLDKGAAPNCRIEAQGKVCSPLIAAVEANQSEIVRHLALRGADLDGKGVIESDTEKLEYTALFAATKAGNTSMMHRLLELGADINEPSTRETGSFRSTLTPLNEAVRLEMTEPFRLLLLWDTPYYSGQKKVEMVTEKDSRISQLHTLLDTTRKREQSSLLQLIKDGANINAVSFQGTPLSVAASYNQPHKVKLLLNHGADVHLASLYLSRSGQQKAAHVLVKTVFGSSSGSRANVHAKFIRCYERLVDMSQSSRSSQIRGFKNHCQNYHQAWSTGIRVMDRICCGNAPDGPARLSETLAFLAVARAVAESSAGDTGDISLIDKFDGDLVRWKMIFPDGDDLIQYCEAVHSLWGVDISGQFFIDFDYDGTETIGQFKGIISRIIEGARGPLDLDSSSSTGLNEGYARWRQRRREPPMPIAHGIPDYPPSPHRGSIDSRGLSSVMQTSNDTGQMTSRTKMDREDILQATKWVSAKRNGSVSGFYSDMTGVASDLIRGVIFSIVFVFIHGLRPLSKLHVRRGFKTIERFVILLKFLGFLESLEMISSGSTRVGAAGDSIGDKDMGISPLDLEIGPRGESCNQWYSFFGCNTGPWI